ncbi:hypothetical protein DAI22_07g154925 [Oryza sativa Japonica Group]|nr:hypothetical protein DAI22_07g154925 [Oryza sativa Japonica Group]
MRRPPPDPTPPCRPRPETPRAAGSTAATQASPQPSPAGCVAHRRIQPLPVARGPRLPAPLDPLPGHKLRRSRAPPARTGGCRHPWPAGACRRLREREEGGDGRAKSERCR